MSAEPKSESPPTPNYFTSVEAVRAWRDQLDADGQKLVFTNGCFDLLHVGHVRYLRQARDLGNALVIGLNSDSSVQALKGPTRPINVQDDRAEVLMALESVNAIVLFSDARATSLIEAIRPHIYTKGGDYTVASLNPEERAALEAVGAQITILPIVPGKSTTATLERLHTPAAPINTSTPPGAVPAIGTKTDDGILDNPNAPLRLGVLGSGRGSNFEAIQRAIAAGTLNAHISVVISDNADAPILEKARAAGLTAVHVNPGPNPNRLPADAQKEICDQLIHHGVQVVVLAGFMRVVKEPLLTTFANRIVNIHPSLLPKYKGKEAWVQALEEGELETGCTVHLVNAEIDAGRILAQKAVPIHIGDTADALLNRIHEAEHTLFPKVLNDWRTLGLPTQ